jgi:hypothetical protein
MGRFSPSMPEYGCSDGALENPDFVRLSASDFPVTEEQCYRWAGDPGIIDLSAAIAANERMKPK